MRKNNFLMDNFERIARVGLTTKGIVYSLLGLLTFMAAFQINGQSSKDSSKSGVFGWIYDLTGGRFILGAIGVGLICYCIWRILQAFADTEDKGKDAKGIAVRLRYGFSALVYGSLAYYALKMSFGESSSSGNGNKEAVATALEKPLGQYLVGIAAIVIAAVGIYQIYYSFSEKYKKHVQSTGKDDVRKVLLKSGKIGYIARGIVWLLIAWLIIKAAFQASSSEAGDTAKALGTLKDAPYGSYLLAAVGLGLVCYGTFNFVRARYENFD